MQANNLIKETSPYLLQHAYNPVKWHTWGEEALKKAKDENKPIFSEEVFVTAKYLSSEGASLRLIGMPLLKEGGSVSRVSKSVQRESTFLD